MCPSACVRVVGVFCGGAIRKDKEPAFENDPLRREARQDDGWRRLQE